MKFKIQNGILLRTVLPALVLLTCVLLASVPLGCKSSIEGVTFLSGDFSSPQLEDLCVKSAQGLELSFNKSVTLHAVDILSKEDDGEDFLVNVDYADEGKRALIASNKAFQIGKPYTMNCQVEDASGNTVTVTAQFKGFNDHPAFLALSEVRIKNKNVKAAPETGKSEFVELYVLREGNLSGLELVNADNGEDARYEFPPIEVKKGEYIVVHYRKLSPEWEDELDENLALVNAPDCYEGARDLFCSKTLKANQGWLGTSDIIVVRNAETSQIQDAFLYSKDKSLPWKGEDFATLSALVEESGVWLNSNKEATSAPESAFDAAKLNSDAHSACRKNVENLSVANFYNTVDKWYEATKSAAQSPGKKNP